MKKNSVYAVTLVACAEADGNHAIRMTVDYVPDNVRAGDYHRNPGGGWAWYTLAVFDELSPAVALVRANVSVHDEQWGMSEEGPELEMMDDDVEAWGADITKREPAERVISAMFPEAYQVFRAKGAL